MKNHWVVPIPLATAIILAQASPDAFCSGRLKDGHRFKAISFSLFGVAVIAIANNYFNAAVL